MMGTVERFARATPWLSARARDFGKVMVVLCINLPFLILALSRYPQGLAWASFDGVYAGLVVLGYYVGSLLLLLTFLFLLAGAWPRFFFSASGLLFTFVLYYFLIDGVVYRMLRVHIDAFWLRYLATTGEGIGISGTYVVLAIAGLFLLAGLEWLAFRLAGRVRPRKGWVIGLTASAALAFVVTQTVHAAAYEVNDTRITALTQDFPFYYPIISHRNALKYGSHLSAIAEVDSDDPGMAGRSFTYPLHEVACNVGTGDKRPNILIVLLESWRADALDSVVTPNMNAFSKRSSVFLDHFSSGNSTPAGVFPVFYGIHSTYWSAVKANNAVIHNPVLIDALEANGYAFGIYAQSHFGKHKITDAVFRGIEIHENFAGRKIDTRDQDMTEQLLAFMETQHRQAKPFLGFAFYKSTHYPYAYPDGLAPFQPAKELNVVLANGSVDPRPVKNDYWNSVHYVDQLVGRLLQRMGSEGLLDSTIVVITSDHGEEFNDNGSGYWGHTGNFTEYQTRVPLIVYVPWLPPRVVKTATAQVDIAPTLMQEGLGCGQNVEDYSNGVNLFGPLPSLRPIIISSYVNHALIVGDDVFVTWPMYVQRYKLNGSKEKTGWPSNDLVLQAANEMGRFHGKKNQGRLGDE
jgi:uncharacterized protein